MEATNSTPSFTYLTFTGLCNPYCSHGKDEEAQECDYNVQYHDGS